MAGRVTQLRPVRPQLLKQEAEKWIRAIVLDSRQVGFADHVIVQMSERDISSRQVWEVLKNGCVIGIPKWVDEYRDWACKMRKTVAGRRITVVVGLESNNKMTVVTTYG